VNPTFLFVKRGGEEELRIIYLTDIDGVKSEENKSNYT